MGMYVFLGLVVLLVAMLITVYNRLVSLRNRFKNSFAQIDVQLTRHHDLIPNLVETARVYMKRGYGVELHGGSGAGTRRSYPFTQEVP